MRGQNKCRVFKFKERGAPPFQGRANILSPQMKNRYLSTPVSSTAVRKKGPAPFFHRCKKGGAGKPRYEGSSWLYPLTNVSPPRPMEVKKLMANRLFLGLSRGISPSKAGASSLRGRGREEEFESFKCLPSEERGGSYPPIRRQPVRL